MMRQREELLTNILLPRFCDAITHVRSKALQVMDTLVTCVCRFVAASLSS